MCVCECKFFFLRRELKLYALFKEHGPLRSEGNILNLCFDVIGMVYVSYLAITSEFTFQSIYELRIH